MDLNVLVANTLVWIALGLVWFRFGDNQISNPTTLYLVFHLLSFVMRPWLLTRSGNLTFLRRHMLIDPGKEDLERALLIANLALVAWVVGALVGMRYGGRGAVTTGHVINGAVLLVGGAGLIVAGLISYWRFAPKEWLGQEQEVTRVASGTGFVAEVSTTTAYLSSLYAIVASVFVVWVCFWGMRWPFALFLGPWFILLMTLGSARTMYLLGSVAVGLAIMSRAGRRWPSAGILVVLGFMLFAFAAGKQWMNQLWIYGPQAAVEEIQATFTSNSDGQSDFMINFDFLVGVVHLVPDFAPFSDFQLMGRPFYFWIPRAIWSDKPVFDFAAAYIGNNVREINFTGYVPTLAGESYMAFGYVSLLTLMMLYGFAFNAMHSWAFRFPVASVERVFGISVSVTMIQVFRDGFISFPFFMMLYFGPCLILWLASELLMKPRESRVPSFTLDEMSSTIK